MKARLGSQRFDHRKKKRRSPTYKVPARPVQSTRAERQEVHDKKMRAKGYK